MYCRIGPKSPERRSVFVEHGVERRLPAPASVVIWLASAGMEEFITDDSRTGSGSAPTGQPSLFYRGDALPIDEDAFHFSRAAIFNGTSSADVSPPPVFARWQAAKV